MIVRPAVLDDAAAMALLINQIIRIGGTTAHENTLSEAKIADYYITGPAVICCHVAEDAGRLIGFQSVDRNEKLPEGWGGIGTFVAPDAQRSGAGVAVINATIRADNAPGLGYYARRGFVDHGADPDFRLKDGRRVGRIHKRFDV